jgi:hypothetical protein
LSSEKDSDKPTPKRKQPKPSFLFRVIKQIYKTLHKYCTNNKQEKPQDRSARITANATVWIAVFTIVLGCVGVLQWYELSQQLGAMREDQRPYVYLANTLREPQYRPIGNGHGQIIWSWNFTNYGKSTAYKVYPQTYIKTGGNTYVANRRETLEKTTMEMPPTKLNFGSVVSGPYFTQEDFDQFTSRDGGIGLLIELEYFDGYGTRYTEAICYDLLATGAHLFKEADTCKKQD